MREHLSNMHKALCLIPTAGSKQKTFCLSYIEWAKTPIYYSNTIKWGQGIQKGEKELYLFSDDLTF